MQRQLPGVLQSVRCMLLWNLIAGEYSFVECAGKDVRESARAGGCPDRANAVIPNQKAEAY